MQTVMEVAAELSLVNHSLRDDPAEDRSCFSSGLITTYVPHPALTRGAISLPALRASPTNRVIASV